MQIKNTDIFLGDSTLSFKYIINMYNHMRATNPFFFGRKASISEKASALSFMESSISVIASTSSGLNLVVWGFSLHLMMEKTLWQVYNTAVTTPIPKNDWDV